MSIFADLLNPDVQKNIAKGFNWLKQLKPKESPFSEVSEYMLSLALVRAVDIILNDRFTDGPGKGGWGKSDKIFLTEFYGEDTANRVEDSVTITVNAIIALRSFISLLMQSNSSYARGLLREIGKIVYHDEYIKRRWNSKYGWGGKLLYDRENDFHIAVCYRHTAMLLRLWLEDERYCNNIPTTYQYLMDNFDILDWEHEGVDTDVLVYVAFKSILNHPQQSKLLDLEKVPMFLKSLEASIISKFDFELEGWTCCKTQSTQENLNARHISRQPFTLCVLSEMANCFSVDGDISHSMERALKETINGRWKVGNGTLGFAKLPGGEPDIALSCLGASVLLRKPKKLQYEMDYLRGTIDFIVTSFVNNPDIAQGVSLWPISYFINDTCEYLHKGVAS